MPTSVFLKAGALAAAAALAFTGCKSAETKSKDAGFVPIFDGKTLAGWSGLPGHWEVRDGTIAGYTSKEAPLNNNTFLVCTNGVVGNFELRLQYRILNGNSGIQYRSKIVKPEYSVVAGYQADFECGKTYSGILYEEKGRGSIGDSPSHGA